MKHPDLQQYVDSARRKAKLEKVHQFVVCQRIGAELFVTRSLRSTDRVLFMADPRGERRRRRKGTSPEAHVEQRATATWQPGGMRVVLLWREDGEVRRKVSSWPTRPATKEALAEWIEGYLESVDDGTYQPSGYQTPPRPHCARIVLNGRVLAEWMRGKIHTAASTPSAT